MSVPQFSATTCRDLFDEAARIVWAEVQAHPEIVRWRETHVHVLLAHELLKMLKSSGNPQLWEHVTSIFDDDSGYHGGTMTWELIESKRRPDILLRPTPKGREAGLTRGLIVEIKCVRSIMARHPQVDDLWIKRAVSNDATEVAAGIEKLKSYSALGREQTFDCALCVFHLHEKVWGAIDDANVGLDWSGGSTANIYSDTLRHLVRYFEAQPQED